LKHLITLLLYIGLSSPGFSQILNKQLLAFEEMPFFNPSWIKQQGIKKMNAEVSTKKDERPIRKTGLTLSYEFDRDGRLFRKTETRILLNRTDTLETFYFYNSFNHLKKVVVKDAYGYYATNYRRNDDGLLTAVYHTREKQLKEGDFEALKTIWLDTILTTERNDSVHRQVYQNSIGKPYKDVFRKYDNRGCLVVEREMNRIGGEFSQVNYTRDSKCGVVSWTYSGTIDNSFQKRTIKYDKLQLISEESFYKNGELSKFRRYSYTSNLQLELFLERNLEKREMRILEFSYEFY